MLVKLRASKLSKSSAVKRASWRKDENEVGGVELNDGGGGVNS